MAPQKEIEYLDSLVRGVYAKRDLPEGHILSDDDVYLAVPLQQGQISCRELMKGEVLRSPIAADEPVMIDAIDSPYASIPSLRALIYNRGLASNSPSELRRVRCVAQKGENPLEFNRSGTAAANQ